MIRGRKLFGPALGRFVLVGLFNTGLGAATMLGFYQLAGLGYWGASALSYFLCSIVSYFLNRHYTFGSQANYFSSGLRFAANIAVCYCLAYLMAKPLCRLVLGALSPGLSPQLSDQIAMLGGMIIFTGFNYLGQRLFVFPEQAGNQPGAASDRVAK
jgi:putative flippase GtrA